MAVTRPEHREWTKSGGSALLLGLRPEESGLWFAADAAVEGWEATSTFEDLPTVVGAAGGREVVEGMYPSIAGLCAETTADFRALEAAKGSGTLVWWCPNRDRIATVTAQLRHVIGSHAAHESGWLYRTVYVEWLIERPASIVWTEP